MPAALTLRSLNHVARQTRRLEESIRFYTEVLGFRLISRPGFSFAGAWLYNAGIQIHLIEDEAAVEPEPAIYSRANHIAFEVEDVDAAEAVLAKHSVPYLRKLIPDRQIHQVFFHDPDGHMVEVGSYGIIDR